MATERWLDVDQADWRDLVAGSALADSYHDAPYHQLAEARGEGEARLFVWQDGSDWLALPLLIRPIDGAVGRRDAGSVYGYAGPFASTAKPPAELVDGFRRALAKRLAAEAIVTLVARLHPLLDQAPLIDGLGTIRPLGETVSIDLTLDPAAQLASYRSNHRRDLKRLARDGYATERDPSPSALATFIEVYHANMRRVGATADYFFDAGYFDGLTDALGADLDLFLCRRDGEVAGGACFMRHGPIVQYHLGAVGDAHLAAAPLKQLLDEARRHYTGAGAEILHLGGGRGGSDDSLFRFKAGFSPRRHPFALWCWVVDPDAYAALTEGRPTTGFFPAYRTPGG
jgi:hypothetical protein